MLHCCAWLCLSLSLAAQAPEPSSPESVAARQAAEIKKAIVDLGDEDFPIRQAASKRLWEAGDSIYPLLEVAAASNDAEVVYRAKKILTLFDQGIVPGISPENRRAIELFWSDSDDPAIDRKTMAWTVGRAATPRSILRMLKLAQSPEIRAALAAAYMEGHPGSLRDMVLQNDPQLEVLLEVPSAQDNRINLASIEYLLITKKLDQRLEATISDQQQHPGHLMLAARAAVMLRAQGNLNRALRIAPANDEHFINSLAIEAGQWNRVRLPAIATKPITRVLDVPADPIDPFDPLGHPIAVKATSPQPVAIGKPTADDKPPVNRGIMPSGDPSSAESLGFQAAIQELQGEMGSRALSLAALRKFASTHEDKSEQVAYKLILNDDLDAASVIIHRRPNNAVMFFLLNAQGRRKDALEELSFNKDTDPAVWYDQFKLDELDDKPSNRLGLALDVASILHSAGKKQQAHALLDTVAQKATGPLIPFMTNIVRKERGLGLRDLSFTHAILLRDRSNEAEMLRALFPSGADQFAAWWKKRHPDGSDRQMLEQLSALIDPDDAELLPLEKLQPQLDDFVEFCKDQTAPERAACQFSIATLLRKHNLPEAALNYTRRAAELDPNPKTLYELAGRLAEAKQFAEASKVYEQCFKLDSRQDIYLYLQGDTKFRSGDEAEGNEIVRTATLLGIGQTSRRILLANNLDRIGLHRGAAYHYDLALRCGELDSSYLVEAAGQIADRIAYSNPERAANLYQLQRLQLLSGNARVIYDRLFTLPHLIHRTRARANLDNGQIDQALEQIRQAQRLLKVDVTLPEEFVPRLVQLDLLDEADEVFDTCYQFHREALTDFPDHAWHRNALAWLLARTDRRLDEALTSAQRAVELSPTKAGYQDTLAEVLYRRGDFDGAVAASRKALALQPANRTMKLRLARFEAIARHDKVIPPDPQSLEPTAEQSADLAATSEPWTKS